MIDNIEKIAKNDRRFFFLDFLAKLIKECPHLQIMVSTCELMESKFIPQSVLFTEIYIMELDPIDSVKLFLNKKGLQELEAKEVYNLVSSYPDNFDWSKVAPDKT